MFPQMAADTAIERVFTLTLVVSGFGVAALVVFDELVEIVVD